MNGFIPYYMRKELSIWISAVSLLLSVAAVCVAFLRSEPIQVEWASLLVGVLSVLVTAALGWQIYNAVYISRKVETIDKTARSITKAEIEAYGHSVKAFVLTLNSINLYANNMAKWAVDNYIKALDEGLKGTDPDGVLLPLGYLENIIRDNKGYIELLPGRRHYYLSVVSRIENDDRRNKLIDFLVGAPEKDNS